MKVNYPILLITDVHTNLFNLRRVLNKHPNHTVICLGDITNLWSRGLFYDKAIVDLSSVASTAILMGNLFDNPELIEEPIASQI